MSIKTWLGDFKRLSYVDMKWLIIWVSIYISFLFLDLLVPNFVGTAIIKYAGIFLCVIYANKKYRHDYLLQLALLFTFLADTILVWTPFVVPGVFVFSFAQFMHFMRLTKLEPKALGYYVCAISLLCALGVAFGLQPIYAIATVYGLLLLCNLITAAKNNSKNNRRFQTRCAFYGFIAFLCCDVCVALRFLILDGALPPFFLPILSYLVWFFYYPSQVLIANSSSTPKFAK